MRYVEPSSSQSAKKIAANYHGVRAQSQKCKDRFVSSSLNNNQLKYKNTP